MQAARELAAVAPSLEAAEPPRYDFSWTAQDETEEVGSGTHAAQTAEVQAALPEHGRGRAEVAEQPAVDERGPAIVAALGRRLGLPAILALQLAEELIVANPEVGRPG